MSLGATALHFAAGGGHAEACEVLLERRAAVGAKTDTAGGESALHWAAGGGHAEVCAVLLDADAEVGGETTSGWTALHAAARGGHAAACAFLLRPNDEAAPPAAFSDGPKGWAKLAKGSFGREALMTEAKAASELRSRKRLGRRKTREMLRMESRNLSPEPRLGAVVREARRKEIARVRKEAEVGSKNIDGKTALHFAAGGRVERFDRRGTEPFEPFEPFEFFKSWNLKFP